MVVYAIKISMYLRSTKRRNQDGTEVEYFQLAHNVRNPRTGKPLAQIIHNFGRADQVDRDSLVRLCRSIARVCGVAIQDAELLPVKLPGVRPRPRCPVT